ncbi:MAG: urease accessory protein [Alphaproteobacteria bacterium]
MVYIFVLGLLFGLRHALDADHIAAVASLATRAKSRRETVRTGLAWGLGHALTLFLVCAAVLLTDIGLPGDAALIAECAVGLMLFGLGLDVLRRAYRDRLHVHGHVHGRDGYHLHMHSHNGDGAHEASTHRHGHANGLPARALVVGLMHGLAGSAALLVVAVAEMGSVANGLIYVALFGVGSMIGMAVLSFTIALPMRHATRYLTFGFNGLNAAVGIGTAALGVFLVWQTAPAVAGLLG